MRAKKATPAKRETRPARRGAVIPVAEPEPIPAEDWSEGSLSVPTAARMLDLSTRTVFKYMDRGQLRWGRLGRDRRIPKIDVARLLAGHPKGA